MNKDHLLKQSILTIQLLVLNLMKRKLIIPNLHQLSPLLLLVKVKLKDKFNGNKTLKIKMTNITNY